MIPPTHRRRRVLLTLALPTLLAPPARAANVGWWSDASGQWHDPNHWSSSPALPGPADAVTIDRPAGSYTVTLSTGTHSISSLYSAENLSLTGGSLSLANPSTLTGSLNMTGGTLTGAGSLTLAAPSSTLSGGSLTGTGALILVAASSLTITGGVLTRPVDSFGSVTLSDLTGIKPNGPFTNRPGATLTKTGTGILGLPGPFTNHGHVAVNQGTLSLTGTASTSSGSFTVAAGAALQLSTHLAPSASMSGGGNLTFSGGNLQLAAPVSTTGSISLLYSGSPTFSATVSAASLSTNTTGATFNAPLTLTSNLTVLEGNIHFNDTVSAPSFTLGHTTSFAKPVTFPSLTLRGQMTLAADSAATGTATFQTNARLLGPGNLTLAGTSTIQSATLAGTGRLVIPAGASLSLAATTTNPRAHFLRPVDNAGSVAEAPSGSYATTDILLGADWNNLPGSSFTLSRSPISSTGTPRINNAGAFVVTGGYPTISPAFHNTGTLSLTSSTLTLAGPFSNTGTVYVTRSTLNITNSFAQLTNSTLSAGTYVLTGPVTDLKLPVPVTTIGPDASVTLAGSIFFPPSFLRNLSTIAGSLTLTVGPSIPLSGPLTITGHLTIDGSTLRVLPGPVISTGTLTITPNIPYSDRSSKLVISTHPLLLAATDPATVRDHLLANRILSSESDATHRLAYADLARLPADHSWRALAQSLGTSDPTTLLTQLALTGDANLNGALDPDDFALLDRSFARSLTNATWLDGDFNYDGAVTSADYLLIDQTYLTQSPPAAPSLLAQREVQFGSAYVSQLLTSVPEPSSLACFGAAFLLPLTHRKTRSKRAG